MNELWSYAPMLLLVLARLGGLFLVAPLFSESAVPVKVRLGLAVVMAVAVAGRAGAVAAPANLWQLLPMVGAELLIGAVIGYAARLVFWGVEFGAYHVGQQTGLSLVEAFDPAGGEATESVRTLFRLLTLVIFLSIGGHRQMLEALLRTFDRLPPGGLVEGGRIVELSVTLLSASFLLALKVAAPVLVALLVATVAMGMLQKTMPQFNILSTGLAVRAMAGLVVLAAGLMMLPPAVEAAWNGTAGELAKWFGTP